MKRLLGMGVVLSLIFTGCTTTRTFDREEFRGTYQIDECVYLSPFVSVTEDWFTLQCQGIVSLVIDETGIEYVGPDEVLQTYSEVEYRNVPIQENLDDFVIFDTENLAEDFTDRYDIYSEGKYSGLTLFLGEDRFYLAKTEILDAESGEYFIDLIFTFTKE